jgi:hypothetical protein
MVVGTDEGTPFSKSVAVNDAWAKSSGEMLVIVDADSWVERPQLRTGIEQAARKEHLVVPWWKSYRFGKAHSEALLKKDPTEPMIATARMKAESEGTGPAPDSCAMVLCIQRQAFERVGGFDPRFRGWGSEDVSFGLSCWTLLGRNEYCLGEGYALWHPRPFKTVHTALRGDESMRVWQRDPGGLNFDLWYRYREAQGHAATMLDLCREHTLPGRQVSLSPTWDPEDMVEMQPEQEEDEPVPIVREEIYVPDDTVREWM